MIPAAVSVVILLAFLAVIGSFLVKMVANYRALRDEVKVLLADEHRPAERLERRLDDWDAERFPQRIEALEKRSGLA